MDVTLLGYAPDADPTIPGVIVNCSAFIPSLRGMKAAPGVEDANYTVLPGTCTGAAVLQDLDGSTRFFAGTSTKLYEGASSNWTDVSATGGYSLNANDKWRFAQFGNIALATAKTVAIQQSSSSVFSEIATAPKAALIETVSNFVFVADTDETTYGDSPDRWWCSALSDHTNWTPSIATQAATARLTGSPGKITGLRRFGENIIIYKRHSMYLGAYAGPPIIWDVRQVPGNIGALSQEVVINVGTPENPKHIFMGYDDFYMFDGSRPVPIGTNRVKQTVFDSIQRQRLERCVAQHDSSNSLIYFYYPTIDTQHPNKCVVYNYRTDRWGRDDRQVEAVLEYVTPSINYETLGTLYSTYDSLPNEPYGTAFLSSSSAVPALFDLTHDLKTLTGAPGASSFTLGDLGDDFVNTLFRRARLRYLTAPTTGQMTNYYRANIGDALTQDAQALLVNGKYDVLREARWHRVLFEHTGAVELAAARFEWERGGDE